MKYELRKIKEVDACPECGHTAMSCINNGNYEAKGYCWECETYFPLEFAEPYDGAKHKGMVVGGGSSSHKMGNAFK